MPVTMETFVAECLGVDVCRHLLISWDKDCFWQGMAGSIILKEMSPKAFKSRALKEELGLWLWLFGNAQGQGISYRVRTLLWARGMIGIVTTPLQATLPPPRSSPGRVAALQLGPAVQDSAAAPALLGLAAPPDTSPCRPTGRAAGQATPPP